MKVIFKCFVSSLWDLIINTMMVALVVMVTTAIDASLKKV